MKKTQALAELDRIIEWSDQDPDAAWKKALDVCRQYRDSRNGWGRKPSAFDLQVVELEVRILIGWMDTRRMVRQIVQALTKGKERP
ncbi:MAG TPA: hypothetical protein VGD78_22935 [Chthoniobacterales bacterium]